MAFSCLNFLFFGIKMSTPARMDTLSLQWSPSTALKCELNNRLHLSELSYVALKIGSHRNDVYIAFEIKPVVKLNCDLS